MSLRLDHIAIACRDVDAALEWYRRVLGFHVVAHKPSSRPGGQPAYLAGPEGSHATLELMPSDGNPPCARQSASQGLSHIAFAVADIAREEARLSSLGVTWLGERGEATGGGWVRSFLDCEGNMLQIVERPPGWRQ